MNKVLAAVVAAVMAVILLLVVVLAAVKDNIVGCATNVVVSGTTKLVESFIPDQLKHWNMINTIGIELGMSESVRTAALSTAHQESQSKNIRFGDRDSLGLFQQRPSQGWGTPEQILDPDYAIRKFYSVAKTIAGYQTMNPLNLALKVQRPDEAAYRSEDNSFMSWVDDAASFIRKAAGNVVGTPTDGQETQNVASRDELDLADLCTVDVTSSLVDKIPFIGSKSGPGELRYPTSDKTIDSKFGQRFHPIYRYWRLHDGVDFSIACGAPVYASADGKVTRVGLNGGKGEYIQIDHGGGIQTGYAHLSQYAPGIEVGVTVKAGQRIGSVGTTGTSTGCHLHFNKYQKGVPVDPAPSLKG